MEKVKIGIDRLHSIRLRLSGDTLRIDDASNDGVIVCDIKNLKKTIRIIEEAYKNHGDLNQYVYGYGRNTIQLEYYQRITGGVVFNSNYISIQSMPTIIKMLKSVKIERGKYIFNKDSLLSLGINDLEYLNQTMRRRKKVLTDNNGCKYIEV